MVNGTSARGCAASAGLVLLLLVACGGKSVAVVDSDAGAGGASGASATSGGGPGFDQLCVSFCEKASAAACTGVKYQACRSGCSELVDGAMRSGATCARLLHGYLDCVVALPDICAITGNPDLACGGDVDCAMRQN